MLPILRPSVWKTFQPRGQPSPHQTRPPSGNLRPHMWLLRPVPCLPPPCLPSPLRTHTHTPGHIPGLGSAGDPRPQKQTLPTHSLLSLQSTTSGPPTQPQHPYLPHQDTPRPMVLLPAGVTLSFPGLESMGLPHGPWDLATAMQDPHSCVPLPFPLAHVASAKLQGSLPSSLLQGFPLGTQILSGIFFHPLLPWLAPHVHVMA